MAQRGSRPFPPSRILLALCLISCLWAVPAAAAGPVPLRKVLLFSNAGREYHEDQSRLLNLLDGMGVDFDRKDFAEAAGADVAAYQLIVVAPVAAREARVPRPLEQQIIKAIARGTNVLWVGGGIWGTFTSTDLADAFGVQYVGQGPSKDVGAASAYFRNPAGEPDRLPLYEDTISTVKAVKADTEGLYHDASGRPLPIPFITHYRPRKRSGHAVFLSMWMLTFWKEAEDTFARAEVLQQYIRRLTPEGFVAKHPARHGHEAVFLLRLEDYVAGGTQMNHTHRLWPIRMERLLEMCRRNALPLNIALVPIYRDPFRDESHTWDEADPVIRTLRRQARLAFDRGGSLIVHGYSHQLGSGPSNFSGADWEVWDDAAKRFLPLAEQKAITRNAFTEVVKQFGIRPAVWETPHYMGNADTARAARDAGFRYVTESDTKLFPNREGYLNRMQGLILNIPETAGNYPPDPDGIKRTALLKQRHLLPRMVRMNGLFYLFYHSASGHQERALENLLTEARRFDLWKPSVEEYARFWEKRQRAKIASRIDMERQQMIVDVTESFAGLTLAARLPDGAAPEEVSINGKSVEAKAQRIDQGWYVYPVLPDERVCRVVIKYQ